MTLVPFDDRDGYIWMNGEMIPWRDAKLHVLSHGLHYGGSVFEGERVYDGTIFKLREHTERLLKSGELIDMELPYTLEQLENACNEVIGANGIENGYVRPIAWRGAEQMAVSALDTSCHVAIACWEWPKYFFPKSGENTGIALLTSSYRRPDPRTVPVQAKASALYMMGTVAKHEADRAGYDDVMMLDCEGDVAESSGSNMFFIKDGKIKTPEPKSFLNGITRQTVIKIAHDMGIEVDETTVKPEEVPGFDEVFVTGTAAEISPVGKIDDTEYKLGEITQKLSDAYQELVRQKPAEKRASA